MEWKYGDGQIHIMHRKQEDVAPHPHSFFELVYVLEGSADHLLNDENIPIQRGDYFIIDTGTVHSYRNTKNFEIVNCLFMPEYIDRALLHCPSLGALLSNQTLRFDVPTDIRTADRIFHDSNEVVRSLIYQMEQEYFGERTGYKEQLRCLITQILVLAVREAEASETPLHPATEATIQYLQKHFREPLCLETLSHVSGYAPQYISNLFHRDTGVSIRTYLQKLRIQKAQKLLETGVSNTAELAQAVGYTDVKHFSLLFRKHTGTNPKKKR